MRQKGSTFVLVFLIIVAAIVVCFLAYIGGFTKLNSSVNISNISTKEKIISSKIDSECNLEITTTSQNRSLPTGMSEFMKGKCTSGAYGKISPSGKYFAYEDISGGVDSNLSLFSIEHNKVLTLGTFGTGSVVDIMFLPDDRLVIIDGNNTDSEEEYLTLFDIPQIFVNYDESFSGDYWYLTAYGETHKFTVKLPGNGLPHKKLTFINGKVEPLSSQGGLLSEFTPDEISSQSIAQ